MNVVITKWMPKDYAFLVPDTIIQKVGKHPAKWTAEDMKFVLKTYKVIRVKDETYSKIITPGKDVQENEIGGSYEN